MMVAFDGQPDGIWNNLGYSSPWDAMSFPRSLSYSSQANECLLLAPPCALLWVLFSPRAQGSVSTRFSVSLSSHLYPWPLLYPVYWPQSTCWSQYGHGSLNIALIKHLHWVF